MPSTSLTEDLCRDAKAPPVGNVIHFDTTVRGLGLRVTAAGAKAWVLNYRTAAGVERRHTIGAFPEISLKSARKRASELKDQIRHHGADPVGNRRTERDAPTIALLCERFLEEHVERKRAKTQADYRSAIEHFILPAWRNRKVADIKFQDVDALHRKVSKNGLRGTPAPYRANRLLAVLSVMFAFARRKGWTSDRPTEGSNVTTKASGIATSGARSWTPSS
jgi:hypothetical protein